MLSGIKGILFDLDGTLRHSWPPANDLLFGFADELGLSTGHAQRKHTARWVHHYWAQSEALMEDFRTYQSLSEAFWKNYSRRVLIELGSPQEQAGPLATQLQQLMAQHYQPQDIIPAEVTKTLQALHAAGFSLAVVSNRDSAYMEILNDLGIAEYFDFALAAGEINSWKPDSKIFLHSVERLGCQPAQTVYVGDNYYADAVGALRAGLQAVLFDPEGLFPEAECPAIRRMDELIDLLT